METTAIPTVETEVREYQQLVDDGRWERWSMDHAQVRLGNLARELDVVSGNHTIEEFAKDIGVGRSTLFGYRQFVRFYPEDTIQKYLTEDSPITYTHMREAMHGNDLKAAIAQLEHWADDLATPDGATFEAEFEGKVDGHWEKVAEYLTSEAHVLADLYGWLYEIRDAFAGNSTLKLTIYREKENVS